MTQAFHTPQSNQCKTARFLTQGLSSVEKLLRQTISVNKSIAYKKNRSHNKQLSYAQKSLPNIVSKLNQNKRYLIESLHKNYSKLNLTYTSFCKNQIKISRDVLRIKKVIKIKITQDNKQNKEAISVEDHQKITNNPSYKMFPLLNQCFDSIFPTFRQNATLFSMDRQVYLLGGYHMHGSSLSFFHKYDYQSRRWQQIKGKGQIPKVSLCYHTVQTCKGNLIIAGGVSLQGQKEKRFISDLLIYDLQKNEWLRTKGGVNLKHHASTIFGTTIMISGGINQKQKFNQELYFISFLGGNLLNPHNFSIYNKSTAHERISKHKLINTYEVQQSVRNQIKYDGIYSFGGQNEHNNLNNDLLFINVMAKTNQNLDVKFKRWQIIQVNNEKPCSRKDHTFNIINKRGIAILAGGIDQNGLWLNDVWTFDLLRLIWTRINTEPRIQNSLGTLAGHCACSIGTTVYLYNGNVENKRQKAFWALQTSQSSLKTNTFITKLPSFKTIHSEKQNNQFTTF